MVSGNFDDPASLEFAFKGASAIFSITDFWKAFADPAQRERAAASGQGIGVFSREYEAQQNRNIIDAAAKVGTLERFIFSSLPDTNKLSGGKYPHVYHFEGKANAEEYGQVTYPDLWQKTSVFYAGYYLENFFEPGGSLFTPKLNEKKDTLVLSLAEYISKISMPFYSPITDTGTLVDALLRAAPGKKVIGVKRWLSFRDFTELLARVLGTGVEFVDETPSLAMGDPDLEKDYLDMIGFCMEFGFDGGKVDTSVVQPSGLGVPVQLEAVEEWCKRQVWN